MFKNLGGDVMNAIIRRSDFNISDDACEIWSMLAGGAHNTHIEEVEVSVVKRFSGSEASNRYEGAE